MPENFRLSALFHEGATETYDFKFEYVWTQSEMTINDIAPTDGHMKINGVRKYGEHAAEIDQKYRCFYAYTG